MTPVVTLLATLGACAAAACGGGEASAAAETPAPTVRAASAIVVDRATGVVLWEKDAHARRPPASLTKVMTAIIVLERVRDLDSWCTVPPGVGEHLVNVVGLRPGERITVRQALRATIIKSANDACLTLAHRVAGSEAAFVRLMNAKAAALGLDDTRFRNSRGKPAPGHYMSADDLARLGRYAMRDGRFRDLCRRRTAVIRWPGHAVRVESRNRLLRYDWANGIKTGATRASGKCLLASGRFDLRALIVVTLREPTREQEVRDAVALFKWADALYERRLLVSAGDLVTTVPVAGDGEVRAVAANSLSRVVRRAAEVQVELTLLASPVAEAPEPGALLGSVTYRADEQVLGAVGLIAGGMVAPSAGP